MSWQSEFEMALMATLEADGTLTALLASTTAIYMQRPYKTAGYPQITISYRDESDTALAGYGKNPVALQIDIWGAFASLDAIDVALLDVLDKRKRAAAGLTASPLTMTSWGCKDFRYLRAHTIPTGVFLADSDSTEVIQRVTEWSVRLYET